MNEELPQTTEEFVEMIVGQYADRDLIVAQIDQLQAQRDEITNQITELRSGLSNTNAIVEGFGLIEKEVRKRLKEKRNGDS